MLNRWLTTTRRLGRSSCVSSNTTHAVITEVSPAPQNE